MQDRLASHLWSTYRNRLYRDQAEARSDAVTMVGRQHQEYKLKLVEADLGIKLEGLKLLEIGSGIGEFVTVSRDAGIDAWGIEPFDEPFFEGFTELSLEFQQHFGIDSYIKKASGEDLPFPTGSFDVAFSYYVLEHVRDPERVLREAIRVLKPGGHLYFVFPNFGSFWEGHYGVPWIPRLNRRWGKCYMKWIWRRDPFLIDELQLMHYGQLIDWVTALGPDAFLVSSGKERFLDQVGSLSFTTAGSVHKVKKILTVFKKVGLLRPLVAVLAALNMHSPFYLILRKNGRSDKMK
jgi:SAM-dependent methyltransferase